MDSVKYHDLNPTLSYILYLSSYAPICLKIIFNLATAGPSSSLPFFISPPFSSFSSISLLASSSTGFKNPHTSS